MFGYGRHRMAGRSTRITNFMIAAEVSGRTYNNVEVPMVPRGLTPRQ